MVSRLVRQAIEDFDMFKHTHAVVVACSGRIDSVILCLLLANLEYSVVPVHVCHSAPSGMEIVERLLQKHGMRLHYVKTNKCDAVEHTILQFCLATAKNNPTIPPPVLCYAWHNTDLVVDALEQYYVRAYGQCEFATTNEQREFAEFVHSSLVNETTERADLVNTILEFIGCVFEPTRAPIAVIHLSNGNKDSIIRTPGSCKRVCPLVYTRAREIDDAMQHIFHNHAIARLRIDASNNVGPNDWINSWQRHKYGRMTRWITLHAYYKLSLPDVQSLSVALFKRMHALNPQTPGPHKLRQPRLKSPRHQSCGLTPVDAHTTLR
jgi:hypothetical protein